MRILIISDASAPQVNGVVTTLSHTVSCLQVMGHEVLMISPADFKTFRNPFYPEAPFVLPNISKLERMIEAFNPECIHIPVEGPLGWAAKFICMCRGLRYTTAYHTKFPEFAKQIAHVPLWIGRQYVKLFHADSSRVMVATDSLAIDLRSYGLNQHQIVMWRRGVDHELFFPRHFTLVKEKKDQTRLNLVYIGRVSKEKNIDAFLNAKVYLPHIKYVVGSGPDLERLQKEYPQAVFLGPKFGDELADTYSYASVFVFPSKTDTFGLVIVEALACGAPVAAYNVTGPKDIIEEGKTGYLCKELNGDLGGAITACWKNIDRNDCVTASLRYSWESCTKEFSANLVSVH